jgi:hypothetical protein
LFKLLFGVKYPQLLKKLVAVLLGIQPERASGSLRCETRRCRRRFSEKSSAA